MCWPCGLRVYPVFPYVSINKKANRQLHSVCKQCASLVTFHHTFSLLNTNKTCQEGISNRILCDKSHNAHWLKFVHHLSDQYALICISTHITTSIFVCSDTHMCQIRFKCFSKIQMIHMLFSSWNMFCNLLYLLQFFFLTDLNSE